MTFQTENDICIAKIMCQVFRLFRIIQESHALNKATRDSLQNNTHYQKNVM